MTTAALPQTNGKVLESFSQLTGERIGSVGFEGELRERYERIVRGRRP
jgi:hypothetical protein